MGTGKNWEIGTAQFLYEKYKDRFKKIKQPVGFEKMVFYAISPDRKEAERILKFYEEHGRDNISLFQKDPVSLFQIAYLFEAKLNDETIGYIVMGPPDEWDAAGSYHVVWPVVKETKRAVGVSTYLNLACFWFVKETLKFDRVSVVMWTDWPDLSDQYERKRKEYAERLYEGTFGLKLKKRSGWYFYDIML